MFRFFIFTVLLCATAASAHADALRVGVAPDYPPLVYLQDGRIVGIEADNARTVSEILGRDLRLRQLPFEQLIPALLAGEIDVIMSGMSITAGRAEQVLFTDSYLQVGQMAILHRDKVARFAQPWSVYREGVRIGVEPGTTGAAFAERELPAATVTGYADPAAAFDGLRNDAIDLFIHDAPTSWRLATEPENDDLISLYAPLTQEMLAWAVRRDHAALAAELNRALALMRGNGSLRYILNRWIPVTVEVR
ncbi:MAG: transporter substrate-binding domain-containing protein [Halioglobus sp.]|nr:transporter substrate-binding domain-containing protein [Halioglobus sp.]